MKENWLRVPDTAVRHIWLDSNGQPHEIPPTFYEEAGTPIDEEGYDMTYSHTEIFNPII